MGGGSGCSSSRPYCEEPTRLADDTCIANPDPNDNILNGICGLTSKCPNGCKSCAGDTCNGYVETGCAMKTEGTNALDSTPEFANCQAYAITNGGAIDNVITFFKFARREEECRVYYSGERDCLYQVATWNMDMDPITGCQTGTKEE